MKIYHAGNGGLSTMKRIWVNSLFNGRLLSYYEILIHPGDKLFRRLKKLNILKIHCDN